MTLIGLQLIFLPSCNIFYTAKTACTIKNNTSNSVIINGLSGYVDISESVIILPGSQFQFNSESTSIGETLSLKVSINGINYQANTRYIQDYKSVSLTLYGTNSYILSDPDGNMIETKDLVPF